MEIDTEECQLCQDSYRVGWRNPRGSTWTQEELNKLSNGIRDLNPPNILNDYKEKYS